MIPPSSLVGIIASSLDWLATWIDFPSSSPSSWIMTQINWQRRLLRYTRAFWKMILLLFTYHWYRKVLTRDRGYPSTLRPRRGIRKAPMLERNNTTIVLAAACSVDQTRRFEGILGISVTQQTKPLLIGHGICPLQLSYNDNFLCCPSWEFNGFNYSSLHYVIQHVAARAIKWFLKGNILRSLLNKNH